MTAPVPAGPVYAARRTTTIAIHALIAAHQRMLTDLERAAFEDGEGLPGYRLDFHHACWVSTTDTQSP